MMVCSTVGTAGGFGSLHDFATSTIKTIPTSSKQMPTMVFVNELV
jgi:hypothetical protein